MMLYKYDDKSESLEKLPYDNFGDYKKKEKDLENLLAKSLNDLYMEDAQLMPIFQETQGQPEPDLCAIDKDGNLVIFELKLNTVLGDTTIQIMRYAQKYGRMKYNKLNDLYQIYMNKTGEKHIRDLKTAHSEAFGLEDDVLPEDRFNNRQKLIVVGSSSDFELMASVDYWRNQGIDIDFIPYRFYKIDENIYFEFFAKPYDYHTNPRDKKGIIFDTNSSYEEDAIWDMFNNRKVSAYGNANRYVKYFNKGDYVFYYHKGVGIVGTGIIQSSRVFEDKSKNELYRKVKLLTPKISDKAEIKCVRPSELRKMFGKNFYFASTAKTPYLSAEECEKLLKELQKKYGM